MNVHSVGKQSKIDEAEEKGLTNVGEPETSIVQGGMEIDHSEFVEITEKFSENCLWCNTPFRSVTVHVHVILTDQY